MKDILSYIRLAINVYSMVTSNVPFACSTVSTVESNVLLNSATAHVMLGFGLAPYAEQLRVMFWSSFTRMMLLLFSLCMPCMAVAYGGTETVNIMASAHPEHNALQY